jgi:hypothetical protein
MSKFDFMTGQSIEPEKIVIVPKDEIADKLKFYQLQQEAQPILSDWLQQVQRDRTAAEIRAYVLARYHDYSNQEILQGGLAQSAFAGMQWSDYERALISTLPIMRGINDVQE